VIVGSAVIEKCVAIPLSSPNPEPRTLNPEPSVPIGISPIQRASKLRKPKGHPQPVWFNPFD